MHSANSCKFQRRCERFNVPHSMDTLAGSTYAFRVPIRVKLWVAAALTAMVVLICTGCTPQSAQDPQLAIKLRWVRNYPKERRRDVDTGLYWALSFLGAKLPVSADVLSGNGDVVTVDLGAAQVLCDSGAAW